MTHFGVLAPPLRGHLDPLGALGAELRARGHRVTVFHQADAARFAGGLDVRPLGAATHPPGSLDGVVARMGRLRGLWGMRAVLRDVAAASELLLREAPGAMRAEGVDVVLADQAEGAGRLVAARLGLPVIETLTALPLDRLPGRPPPWLPWQPATDAAGRRREDNAWRIARWIETPVRAPLEAHAHAWKVQAARPLLRVSQGLRELDPPWPARHDEPAWTGPWRSARVDPWTPGDDPRPLAFCSLGTLQGNRAGVFRRVATACREAGLRLVLAHGGALSRVDLGPDVEVHALLPQRAVLRHAAVCITHCGYNTVLDALAAGVPMLCLPLAFEQPGTAARLARAGVARVASPHAPFAGPLARHLRALRDDAHHRRRAADFAAIAARTHGAVHAAELIETALKPAGVSAPRQAAATMARPDAGDARGAARSGNS